MSTTMEKAPSEALSLFLDQDEKGQVDSSVPVRWCISRETAKMIEEKDIIDPQLVIVIEQDGVELERYVTPLEDQMRYIQFRRPGKNVIHATIMRQGDNADESVKKLLSKRHDNGTYRIGLLRDERPKTEALDARESSLRAQRRRLDEDMQDYDKERAVLTAKIDQVCSEAREMRASEPLIVNLRGGFDSIERIGDEFQFDVMVPEEMFAKEPPRWMKWLGTHYSHWNSAARDQCDLRRRALFTLFTLPFYWCGKAVAAVAIVATALVYAVGFEIAALASVLGLLIAGKRDIGFGVLLDPLDGDLREIWDPAQPSFWWNKKVPIEFSDRYRYELRHPVLTVLNPLVVLSIVAIGIALYVLLSASLFQLIMIVVVSLFIVTALIIGILASDRIAQAKESHTKRIEREEEERKERQKLALRKDLEQLACTSASRMVSVSALPRERQTVALRFQAFKSQVCKPFAR